MKARQRFHIASGIFLLATIVCATIALWPVKSGVRIPVHCKKGTMGYIDSEGAMVIDPDWRTASAFGSDDRALVSMAQRPSQFGRLFGRRQPDVTIDYQYRIDRFGYATPYTPPHPALRHLPSELTAELNLIHRAGFSWLLKDGTLAFPGNWRKALDFIADDPAAVYENGRWGFIDKRGKAVIPFLWDETLGFNGNGLACVAINRKWGVIDTTGSLVVPLYFQSLAGYDDEGMCAAQLTSGWGFIDRHGKILIPFRYKKAETFDRFDMAKVAVADNQGEIRCGWISRRGETLVPPIYDDATPLWATNFPDHELLPVMNSTGAQLIDRSGRIVVANPHGDLHPVEDPMAPGKFWIRTAPYRSSVPPSVWRPPFEPACYDGTGKLIWNDGILASTNIPTISAIASGLIALSLFIVGRRFPHPNAASIQG